MSEVIAFEAFGVVQVRAENGGPYTLTGTNTWVLGRDPAWVVDPGPALPDHLDAIAAVVAECGGPGGIALTHSHADHTEAVPALLERLETEIADGPLERVPLPGHSDDHVVFVWNGVCCAGDAVLGEDSVFVAGDMKAYLEGLAALRERDLRLICPGHGPIVRDPRAKLTQYLDHRLDRERRLAAALAGGVRGEEALLDAVWDDAPSHLRGAAALTLNAHLRKLSAEGRLPGGVDAPLQRDVPAV